MLTPSHWNLNICILYRPLELEVLPGYLIHPYSHKHDLQQRLLLSLGQNYWVWAYHGRSNPGLNCHHATFATFSSPGSQAAALQICMVRYARFHPLFIAFLQTKPPFHPVFGLRCTSTSFNFEVVSGPGYPKKSKVLIVHRILENLKLYIDKNTWQLSKEI